MANFLSGRNVLRLPQFQDGEARAAPPPRTADARLSRPPTRPAVLEDKKRPAVWEEKIKERPAVLEEKIKETGRPGQAAVRKELVQERSLRTLATSRRLRTRSPEKREDSDYEHDVSYSELRSAEDDKWDKEKALAAKTGSFKPQQVGTGVEEDGARHGSSSERMVSIPNRERFENGRKKTEWHRSRAEWHSSQLQSVLALLHPSKRRREGLTVAQVMAEHGPQLTKHEVEEVIKWLQQRKDAKGTLQAFRWAKRQSWFKPNIKFYNSMMGFLTRTKEPEAAVLLFQEMFLEKLRPNQFSYTTLINAFGRSGQLDDALSVFEYMKGLKDSEMRPNTVTCNVLMKALCRGKRFDAVAELFLDMFHGRGGLDRNCSPSIVTYNTLLDALCQENLVDVAFELLNDLAAGRLDSPSLPGSPSSQGGVKPWLDLTHGKLADGSFTGRPKDLDTHQPRAATTPGAGQGLSGPLPVRPNTVTYNILIDAYGKAGQVEKAEHLVSTMEAASVATPELESPDAWAVSAGQLWGDKREGAGGRRLNGVAPDVLTYTALLDAYGRCEDVEKAEDVLERMQNKGIVPDVHAFTALLSAYNRAVIPDHIPRTLMRMSKSGVYPNEVTYLTVLDTYGKSGDLRKAEETMEEMLRAGLRPGVLAWSALIDAYGRAGEWRSAADTFRRMQEEGRCMPSPVTYSGLLSACARCPAWEEALVILYTLQQSGNDVGVALCQLLMSGAQDGDKVWPQASSVLIAFVKSHPRELSRSLFNTLADALWSFGMRARAAKVVKLGRQHGFHPEDRVHFGAASSGKKNGRGSGRKSRGLAVLGWGGVSGGSQNDGESDDEEGGMWSIDLHGHSLGSGAAFLYCWLNDLRQVWKWKPKRIPEAVEIITGWGRHTKNRESVLKKLVEGELQALGSPFLPLAANPGRLVATGWSTYLWLMQGEMESWLALLDSEQPTPTGGQGACRLDVDAP